MKRTFILASIGALVVGSLSCAAPSAREERPEPPPPEEPIDAGADASVAADVSVVADADEPRDASTDTPPDPPVNPCDDLEAAFVTNPSPPADPAHHGTVWFDPDIVTEADPSSFEGLTYSGQQTRIMFDRRTAAFGDYDAHLFDARFGSETVVEIQVNPEFDRERAESEAIRHAEAIGRLPAFLFRDLKTVWIHDGVELYGGGNDNILIHTGQTASYVRDGVLDEVLIHEATHTSMDSYYARDPLWLAAQRADGVAISNYARDYPEREDLSETLAPYLALRHRRDRLDASQITELEERLANRILYLDCLELTMDTLE